MSASTPIATTKPPLPPFTLFIIGSCLAQDRLCSCSRVTGLRVFATKPSWRKKRNAWDMSCPRELVKPKWAAISSRGHRMLPSPRKRSVLTDRSLVRLPSWVHSMRAVMVVRSDWLHSKDDEAKRMRIRNASTAVCETMVSLISLSLSFSAMSVHGSEKPRNG